mmetsp:Transcript_107002/g.149157  ORF Transcript_107002/g.149157 Transcript_107002/m.149157 type:complete len:104 (+) Transcript_107002:125-436(+)
MGKEHELAKKGDVNTLQNILPVSKLGRAEMVNRTDKKGWTPLMHAVNAGKAETVKFLIECRANVGCADKTGTTPVRLAHMNDHDDVLELLLSIASPSKCDSTM